MEPKTFMDLGIHDSNKEYIFVFARNYAICSHHGVCNVQSYNEKLYTKNCLKAMNITLWNLVILAMFTNAQSNVYNSLLSKFRCRIWPRFLQAMLSYFYIDSYDAVVLMSRNFQNKFRLQNNVVSICSKYSQNNLLRLKLMTNLVILPAFIYLN